MELALKYVFPTDYFKQSITGYFGACLRAVTSHRLERLKPRNVVIPAGEQTWYDNHLSNWAGMFPHDLIRETLNVLDSSLDIRITGEVGNLIYKYTGGSSHSGIAEFDVRPDDPAFTARLAAEWP